MSSQGKWSHYSTVIHSRTNVHFSLPGDANNSETQDASHGGQWTAIRQPTPSQDEEAASEQNADGSVVDDTEARGSPVPDLNASRRKRYGSSLKGLTIRKMTFLDGRAMNEFRVSSIDNIKVRALIFCTDHLQRCAHQLAFRHAMAGTRSKDAPHCKTVGK